MVSSSKVETNNCESGAINKGVLEEMKSLLHEFEGVETEIVYYKLKLKIIRNTEDLNAILGKSEPTVQRRPKHNRSAIAMMTDAVASLPKNENEHIYLGLRELKKVYGDQVDIYEQFRTTQKSTGDAMFFPDRVVYGKLAIIMISIKDKNEVNIPLAIQSCENIPEYATTKGFERLMLRLRHCMYESNEENMYLKKKHCQLCYHIKHITIVEISETLTWEDKSSVHQEYYNRFKKKIVNRRIQTWSKIGKKDLENMLDIYNVNIIIFMQFFKHND
ncbi:hypothetical protein C2G38_2137505 [Gigaspora rosea]|uniref:Uncharacterized protein n=1 Tax=Gigaspora rosea TaxID=44941 RepID=A0A397W1H9_9GLOM|nr:hypothetical protein C2G38_2137505 [Gigaspora rosea]